MGGIGVIQNRKAGKKRAPFRGTIGEKLGYVIGDPGSLHETSRVEEIAGVAQTFFEQDIDILGIGGGDGSNHYVLDALIKAYGDKPLPRVAFLCGGTHNAHAMSVGVKGIPAILLQNIVRKYHTGARFDLKHRVILRIDDGLRVHHGFSMATGFGHRFYEELVQQRTDSALKVAAQLALWVGDLLTGGRKLRKIFRLEPTQVVIGGETLAWEETNGVSCSGMEMLGLGLVPFPRASETAKTFHLGVVRFKPSTLVRFIADYRLGRVPKHPDSHTDIASDVQITMEQPISYVLDGELYKGSEKLRIQTGPRIELIVG